MAHLFCEPAILIGFAAEAPVVPAVYDAGVAFAAELQVQEEERVTAALAAAERRFRSPLPPDSAGWTEWCSFAEPPAQALAREARCADLLVVGAGGGTDAGDVLLRAGRPVLVVPANVALLKARKVIVAWRDVPQARRAVADALPLLQQAESVLVLEVLDHDGDASRDVRVGTQAVVRLLARHGVIARADARPLREPTVADELIRVAEDHDADLIVSGGYGHARLREWAFGGVTRDLLTRCPVCCLLSH